MSEEFDQNKIVAEIATNAVKDIYYGSKDIVKNITNKFKIVTGIAFEDYFQTTIKKYSKTKTILFHNIPVHISDFFVHPTLRMESNNNYLSLQNKKKYDYTKNSTFSSNFVLKNISDFENKLQIFENQYNKLKLNKENINEKNSQSSHPKFFMICGIAGCGKSMLLKYLFLNCLETDYGIPFFFSLRDMNITKLTFTEFILKDLKAKNLNIEWDEIERLLKRGNLIFLLDGVDEIEPKKSIKISSEIIAFCDKYYKNKFFITSRPQSKLISWNRFHIVNIMPLEKSQVLMLINKLNTIQEIYSRDFYDNVNDTLFDKYKDFLSNPLLLTMMFLLNTLNGNIPNERISLYQELFDTLYIRHDATKESYQRIYYSNLSKKEFIEIFCHFSYMSYIQSKYEFTFNEFEKYIENAQNFYQIDFIISNVIEDFKTSLSLIIEIGLKLTFAHLSFQEYYAAIFILSQEDNIRKKMIISLFENYEFSAFQNILSLMHEMNRFTIESILTSIIFKESNLIVDHTIFMNLIEHNRKNIESNPLYNFIKNIIVMLFEKISFQTFSPIHRLSLSIDIKITNNQSNLEKSKNIFKIIDLIKILKTNIFIQIDDEFQKVKEYISFCFTDNNLLYKLNVITFLFDFNDKLKNFLIENIKEFPYVQEYIDGIFEQYIYDIIKLVLLAFKMNKSSIIRETLIDIPIKKKKMKIEFYNLQI